jgi:hypothetical protein
MDIARYNTLSMVTIFPTHKWTLITGATKHHVYDTLHILIWTHFWSLISICTSCFLALASKPANLYKCCLYYRLHTLDKLTTHCKFCRHIILIQIQKFLNAPMHNLLIELTWTRWSEHVLVRYAIVIFSIKKEEIPS